MNSNAVVIVLFLFLLAFVDCETPQELQARLNEAIEKGDELFVIEKDVYSFNTSGLLIQNAKKL